MNTKSPQKTLTDTAAAEMLSAMGSVPRLLIYRTLLRAGSTGLTISTLQAMTDIAASTLKHHLLALVDADLVSQERQGREVYCSANFQNVRLLSSFLLQECCALDVSKVGRDRSPKSSC
jgi:ArsR family transcriptional regulator, arsenate/arsenite/antimonite-responsive transcriptional repressor